MVQEHLDCEFDSTSKSKVSNVDYLGIHNWKGQNFYNLDAKQLFLKADIDLVCIGEEINPYWPSSS